MESSVNNMFSAVENIVISGGNFNQINGPSGSQRGRDIIIQAASPKAFYDSRQQFETPKRLTGVQVHAMNAIRDWMLDKRETRTPLMWLYGSAGSGKTVLARNIANWNSSSSFIPTIAYGISQAVPSVRPLMDLAADKDPLIFSRSLEIQFVKLVIEPLVELSRVEALPYVIVIDGLDECPQSNEQKAIFDLFTFALDCYSLPWKILISSRPEQTLRDSFQGCRSPRCLFTSICLSHPANHFELPPYREKREVQEEMPKQTHTTNPKQRGLRLLSIDGGGIRGLSPLLILHEMLYRIKSKEGLTDLPKPCEIFDLAGGTGTGGLIVLMLFRLQMTIDAAITAYAQFARFVFSEKKGKGKEGMFKSSRLEKAIVDIIKEQLKIDEVEARNLPLFDQTAPKCFVCATPSQHLAFPTIFRTWERSKWPAHDCTVVEVARATSASPFFFKSVEIGNADAKETFVDAGLKCNNPVQYILQEAESLSSIGPMSCIISLGSGVPNVIGLDKPDAFQKLLPKDFIKVLKDIATDCEATGEEVARKFTNEPDFYFRLNVDRGLQSVSLAEWDKLGTVKTHTDQYMLRHEVSTKLATIVKRIISEGLQATS